MLLYVNVYKMHSTMNRYLCHIRIVYYYGLLQFRLALYSISTLTEGFLSAKYSILFQSDMGMARAVTFNKTTPLEVFRDIWTNVAISQWFSFFLGPSRPQNESMTYLSHN